MQQENVIYLPFSSSCTSIWENILQEKKLWSGYMPACSRWTPSVLPTQRYKEAVLLQYLQKLEDFEMSGVFYSTPWFSFWSAPFPFEI